ncbi:MAG TPA: D-cysteine desulfhydrase family protein, partial [Bacillota bacterium]|nr:D-cysteine desulfhydrase family protein [Bacillota bacterium]
MFLQKFPRVKLASLPTALDHAPRLSRELGVDLYLKRDDNTGLALGGNKARKLEYLAGQALAMGCDTLITTGGPQSNHCRMTAAAAAKLGLDCHLAFTSDEIPVTQGNLLLDVLLGAKLHYIGSGENSPTPDDFMADLAAKLQRQGKRPYVIPLGGSNSVGALGYIRGVMELIGQAEAEGVSFDYVIHASGSAGTQAGILAGIKYFALPGRVLGISVSRPTSRLSGEVLSLCNETLDKIGSGKVIGSDDVHVYDQYVGGGYGTPTELSLEATTL